MTLLVHGSTALARDSIDEILDRIDSKTFIYDEVIGFASGQGAVRSLMRDTPEIKYLINHPEVAIPKMLRRLSSPGGLHYDPTRVAYFVVFEYSKDISVLPALADYLDSIPNDQEIEARDSRFHPFKYALWASWKWLGCTVQVLKQKYKSEHEVFLARHAIANQLRSLFQTREFRGGNSGDTIPIYRSAFSFRSTAAPRP